MATKFLDHNNNKYHDTDRSNAIFGRDGNDTLYGNGGDDALYGDNDNDILYGGAGQDKLWGGNGDDHLFGGGGKDLLTGNGQRDVFHFVSRQDSPAGPDRDVITDFYHLDDASRQDLIDLTELGPLDFIGSAAFWAPGQVRWVKEGAGPVVIQINFDGATGAEMEIQLNNLGSFRPEADWFVLA